MSLLDGGGHSAQAAGGSGVSLQVGSGLRLGDSGVWVVGQVWIRGQWSSAWAEGRPPTHPEMGLLSHLCLRCLESQSPPPCAAPAPPTSAPAHALPSLPWPGLVLPLPSCRLFLSLVPCLLVHGSPLWLPLQQEHVASGPGAGAGLGKWAEGGTLTSRGERVTWRWDGSAVVHFSSHPGTDLSQRLASFLGLLGGDRCGPVPPCTLAVPEVWVRLELSESHGVGWTRLVGFCCGGEGFFYQ